ncbi:unnamed protein product, partial [Citrullus colocynthis]
MLAYTVCCLGLFADLLCLLAYTFCCLQPATAISDPFADLFVIFAREIVLFVFDLFVVTANRFATIRGISVHECPNPLRWCLSFEFDLHHRSLHLQFAPASLSINARSILNCLDPSLKFAPSLAASSVHYYSPIVDRSMRILAHDMPSSPVTLYFTNRW